MISFIHLQLRIINSLCITLPVLTSRVRNKARCISPQASISWGWGTTAAAHFKSKIRFICQIIARGELISTSHSVSLPGARPPVFSLTSFL